MSCLVMEPESIAALSEFIASLLNFGLNHHGFEAPYDLGKALIGCRDPYCFFDPQKIYERLYMHNTAAHIGNYGPDAGAEHVPQVKTGDYQIHQINYQHELAPWHFRLAKLLHCYNYQIAEDATIKHPLTAGMRELEHRLNSFIVVKSPEYEAAPNWGRFDYMYEEKREPEIAVEAEDEPEL